VPKHGSHRHDPPRASVLLTSVPLLTYFRYLVVAEPGFWRSDLSRRQYSQLKSLSTTGIVCCYLR